MATRTIELAAFGVALLVAALATHAWLASHDEMQRLQSTLTAQKQVIDAADSRERARDTALNDTLAQIAKLKRATQTPEEILRELPKYLPLPQPVTLVASDAPAAPPLRQGTALPREPPPPIATRLSQAPAVAPSPSLTPTLAPAPRSPQNAAIAAGPSGPVAQIPAADLKPLYDYVQDCRSCDVQLAAAKQGSADDASKIVALTRERDAAITAAKGGSFWRRLRRNALWFLVGAAGGYVAAKR
jgi:hypothetical protein